QTIIYPERENRGTREREEWQSGGRAVGRSRHLVKRGRGRAASDWRRAVAASTGDCFALRARNDKPGPRGSRALPLEFGEGWHRASAERSVEGRAAYPPD